MKTERLSPPKCPCSDAGLMRRSWARGVVSVDQFGMHASPYGLCWWVVVVVIIIIIIIIIITTRKLFIKTTFPLPLIFWYSYATTWFVHSHNSKYVYIPTRIILEMTFSNLGLWVLFCSLCCAYPMYINIYM